MLVIIAYLVGILIRKRNDSRIAELEERKQRLFDLPINEEIEEVKKHFTWLDKVKQLPWMESEMDDISTNSFRRYWKSYFWSWKYEWYFFFKASGEINNIESQLDLVKKISSLSWSFLNLKEQEERTVLALSMHWDLYEELQNSIEENSIISVLHDRNQ